MVTSNVTSNTAPNKLSNDCRYGEAVAHRPGRRGLLARMWAVILAVILVGALLAGCAKNMSPGQEAPQLASTLDRVDAAVAAGHLSTARSDVETLIRQTNQARQRRDITASQAEQILDAARSVLAQLPAATPKPSPSPTPAASPSQTSQTNTQPKQPGPKSRPGDGKTTKADKKHPHKPAHPHRNGGGNGNNGNDNGDS